jgi:predicted nucleotidyltransferase
MSDILLLDDSEAFKELVETFRENSVKYFLIGGLALDLHYHQKEIDPPRTTRDIDFAVMVATWDEYERLKELLTKKGFEKTKEPYRLIRTAGGTLVDLLPFGHIEKGHSVFFPGSEVEVVVTGFKEVMDEIIPLTSKKGKYFSVYTTTLHGLFLLKLLSWHDKRAEREKDLEDIVNILENYWEFVEEEAYEEHPDLFDEEDFDTQKAAARILGRHLRKTLEKSAYIKQTVLDILEKEIFSEPPGPLPQKFSLKTGRPLDSAEVILKEILFGINDKNE